MTNANRQKLPPTAPEDVREAASQWLYDIALNPEHIETRVDEWEALVSSLRPTSEFARARVLDDSSTAQHYTRAVKIMDRLSDSTEDDLAPYGHLPAFLVAEDLSVHGLNAAAASFAATDGAITLPFHPEDRSRIQNLLRAVVQDRQATRPETLHVEVPNSGRLTLLHIKRAAPIRHTRLAIIAFNETRWPEGFDDTLRASFDLTKTEMQIVRGLLEHGSLADLATIRKRSKGTLRNQMKSILSKTETRSQVELVRVVMSLMDLNTASMTPISDSYRSGAKPNGVMPVVPRLLQRPDGRRVEYLVTGHPEGRPVLHFSGDFAFVRAPSLVERQMILQGLKFIIPLRPGYGNTDPAPPQNPYGDTLISDFLAVTDAEGAGRFPILSFETDSYFALRTAATAPDRVTAVYAMAGVLPCTRPEQIERMQRWQRFVVGAARYTPHLTPFLIRACFAMARRMGPDKFLQMIFSNSPADLAALAKPEIHAALMEGAPFVLAPGGGVEQAVNHLVTEWHQYDWTDDVHAVSARIPVHFWNGAQDQHTPPASLQEFREDFPDVDFRLIGDAGCLLFYTHWSEVLDALLTHTP